MLVVQAYVKDPWNYFDVSSYFTTLLGELLLVCYGKASTASRVVQAIACVLLWFKLLYYCRAHPEMGPVGTPNAYAKLRGVLLRTCIISHL
jgi:hypothetical protein